MNLIAKFVGWCGLTISWLLVHIPQGLRRVLGSFLGILWYDVFRIRRQVVLDNLKIAFPEMPAEQRVQIGRKSLMHLGQCLLEYAFLPFLAKENVDELFGFENLEVVDESLKKGCGVILLTCHIGNGDLATAGLALKGYRVYMVSKFFKFRMLNDLWFGMRRKAGLEFIPPRDSSYTLLKALKKNALVVIPLDQFTGPPIGVKTTFFGRETGTAAGLSLMADRSGAPVVACFTYRQPNGKHVLRFVQRFDVKFSEDRDSSMVTYTQQFNDVLEEFVREYPGQWMWIHRRWKRFVVT